VFSDISGIKDSQKQLDRLTYLDTLTNLPNRRLFMQRLEHALSQAKRRARSLAIIVLDLDNFKYINEGLGHAAGDELLQSVANSLTGTLRDEDTVARLGGDEFAVLLEDIESPDNATSLAAKLIDKLDLPLTIQEQEVRVTSSMGICFYPQDGEDSDTLMRNADAAMYRAKEDGRNCYHFYTEALTARSVDRLNMEKCLRQSLDNNDFYLVYQPQVELKSGKLVGVEALVRWEHPEMGLISPVRFIPMAEESGLIYRLEKWIFNEACRQARVWLDQGIKFGRMAINLSGKSIHAGDVPKIISQVLLENRCPANVIELEVSEGFIMQRAVAAIEQLNTLRQMGIALSIDDFGTGYSSLSYLKQLPIDKLKIDQAFVRDVTVDENDRAIVSAVIAMGKKLNMTVIAEGVETRAQARFLLEEGCEEAQGYLYSKPVRPEDLELLQQQLLQSKNGNATNVVIFPSKDAE
jgi:diguanylate cyclase (GGDEF)-like protein